MLLGIGMSDGQSVSTQILKKFGDIGCANVQWNDYSEDNSVADSHSFNITF